MNKALICVALLAAAGVMAMVPAEAKALALNECLVVKVDGVRLTVSFTNSDNKTEEMTFRTDDKTIVTVDGKAAPLADLKVGQQIRSVSYVPVHREGERPYFYASNINATGRIKADPHATVRQGG